MSIRGKFPLGQIMITPGALDALNTAGEVAAHFLGRHASGDWGTVPPEDAKENEFSLTRHLRLMSAYTLSTGVKIWIITESDRSITTVLLPEDY